MKKVIFSVIFLSFINYNLFAEIDLCKGVFIADFASKEKIDPTIIKKIQSDFHTVYSNPDITCQVYTKTRYADILKIFTDERIIDDINKLDKNEIGTLKNNKINTIIFGDISVETTSQGIKKWILKLLFWSLKNNESRPYTFYFTDDDLSDTEQRENKIKLQIQDKIRLNCNCELNKEPENKADEGIRREIGSSGLTDDEKNRLIQESKDRILQLEDYIQAITDINDKDLNSKNRLIDAIIKDIFINEDVMVEKSNTINNQITKTPIAEYLYGLARRTTGYNANKITIDFSEISIADDFQKLDDGRYKATFKFFQVFIEENKITFRPIYRDGTVKKITVYVTINNIENSNNSIQKKFIIKLADIKVKETFRN